MFLSLIKVNSWNLGDEVVESGFIAMLGHIVNWRSCGPPNVTLYNTCVYYIIEYDRRDHDLHMFYIFMACIP